MTKKITVGLFGALLLFVFTQPVMAWYTPKAPELSPVEDPAINPEIEACSVIATNTGCEVWCEGWFGGLECSAEGEGATCSWSSEDGASCSIGDHE